jgi:hypothetical protein
MAQKYFGTEDPIGPQIKFATLDRDPQTEHNVKFSIIGVVSDFANQGIERPPPRPSSLIRSCPSGTSAF